MKVLVTGSFSDLGREVVEDLLLGGHAVIGFDRLRPADYPTYTGEDKPKEMRFLGDVRDFVAVSEAVAISDAVIHLAMVNDSDDNPGVVIEYNMLGAVNVFQACRQYARKCAYVVPPSEFNAQEVAFRFNALYTTEIAVIHIQQSATGDDNIAQGIIDAVTLDHFNYEDAILLFEPRTTDETTVAD